WAVNETPKRAKKWTFNYPEAKVINNHKQMRNMWDGRGFNVWESPVVPASERRLGNHPAQKPRALVNRLVELFTRRGDLILDPFAGTGVVALSATAYLRDYVLVEKSRAYVRTARARLRKQQASREVIVIRKLGESAMTLSDAELRILQSVPVPQADILDKVFEVAELVANGVDTTSEIADQLEMAGRQGPYYAEAAVALRLIGVRKDVTAESADKFYLTELGRDYLDADPEKRVTKRRFAVLNSPILKYVSSRLGLTENGAMIPYPPPGDLSDESTVEGVLKELDLTGRTLHRRAQTIRSWVTSI
ncbi:MAG: site-specific DNA-methyltransferase, partial [Chloroflexi bacterium]|nr:site-specific DNA-methyltransferase [Chloroflexota bacterium]